MNTSPHWRECCIEATALGLFMLSAAVCATALYHPLSPVVVRIPHEFARRVVMGLAMGATAAGLIYSPWGQRSGAHMNPSVTLTFFRLGRIGQADCLGYVLAQFAGALAGIGVAALLLRGLVSHPAVHYVATVPGRGGAAAAFVAEAAMSFLLMLTVLTASSRARLTPYTGLCAAVLVCAYIVLEAPVSGMSLNPARSFGSAVAAWDFCGLWIYVIAPPLGMLLAAETFRALMGRHAPGCAKLHHSASRPCIFCGAGRCTSQPVGSPSWLKAYKGVEQ